jgi:hypothetical protein
MRHLQFAAIQAAQPWPIWAIAVFLNIYDALASLACHLQKIVKTEALSGDDSRPVALNEDVSVFDESKQVFDLFVLF